MLKITLISVNLPAVLQLSNGQYAGFFQNFPPVENVQ